MDYTNHSSTRALVIQLSLQYPVLNLIQLYNNPVHQCNKPKLRLNTWHLDKYQVDFDNKHEADFFDCLPTVTKSGLHRCPLEIIVITELVSNYPE